MRRWNGRLQYMDVKRDATYWIQQLRLAEHPEGGYYRETYAAELRVGKEALPSGFHGPRAASTAIYFLLDGENFSGFHRIQSDELWHFYAGTSLVIHVIAESGEYSKILLGNDLEEGQTPQAVVTAGCWFASRVQNRHSYALVGCTVAPGFHFEDFELAERSNLIELYPQHEEMIKQLTRV